MIERIILEVIDFVKFKYEGNTSCKWESNELLDFETLVRLNTGELSDGKLIAKYKGLVFKIIPSTIEGRPPIYELSGSLHVFSNDGQHNFDDFHYSRLVETIDIICRDFKLNPQECLLRNLEFGVNIELPSHITAKHFIRNLVCFNNDKFTELKVDKVNLGKTSKQYEYAIKIYDKGIQSNIPQRNLLRVELKVTRMRFLQKWNITTLSDLKNSHKLQGLGYTLCKSLLNVVFYEESLHDCNLSSTDYQVLKEYGSSRFWATASKKQRFNLRRKYESILSDNNENNVLAIALCKVLEKWVVLLMSGRFEADIGERFHHLLFTNGSRKKGTISPLECHVITFLLDKKNNTLDLSSYTPPSKEVLEQSDIAKPDRTFCATCGRDISHQRTGSKFCSEKYFGKAGKRCRNAASNEKRKRKTKIQKDVISKILEAIPTTDFLIQINYRSSNKKIVEYQKSLSLAMIGQLSEISSIEILLNNDRHTLTGARLNKIISKVLNNQSDERKEERI